MTKVHSDIRWHSVRYWLSDFDSDSDPNFAESDFDSDSDPNYAESDFDFDSGPNSAESDFESDSDPNSAEFDFDSDSDPNSEILTLTLTLQVILFGHTPPGVFEGESRGTPRYWYQSAFNTRYQSAFHARYSLVSIHFV